MLAWKVCAAIVAATLLAASAARADDDGTATIVASSAEAQVAPVADGNGTINITGNLIGAAPVDGQMVVSQRGGYWLGVIASRPSPALQAQLKLPKDQGIVVDGLEPGSPAIKAGIQKYDILLKGNDKPLAGLHDLFQLTNEVKEGKLKLDLLRAGKHETVTVTPAKHPAHEMGPFGAMRGPEGAAAGWIQNGGPMAPQGGLVRFHVIHPGQILSAAPITAPPGGPETNVSLMMTIKTKLSDGSKIEISREGQRPVKVVVTRGHDKWEGNSDDLSNIPEKIRPEVEKLLHQAFDHNMFFAAQSAAPGNVSNNFVYAAPGAPGMPGSGSVTVFAMPAGPGGGPAPNAIAVGPAPGMQGGIPGPVVAGGGPIFFNRPTGFEASPEVEQRLAEMQKQLDELRHTVDALKAKGSKSE